jgi:hypothetical protein
MLRTAWMFSLTLALGSLFLFATDRASAQPPAPCYSPAPVVSYYSPPVVYAPAPTVSYYSAPAVSYYPPTVSYYAPAVSYYAAPAPVVSYYSAPAVVTTTRYGLLGRPRYTTTYIR